jgi:hypothetical protein
MARTSSRSILGARSRPLALNRILAAVARKGGGKLLDAAIGKVLPTAAAPAQKVAKKTMLGGVAGMVAMRVATRSVPGAILVGGAVIAKKLYDRRHAGKAPRGSAPKKDATKP